MPRSVRVHDTPSLSAVVDVGGHPNTPQLPSDGLREAFGPGYWDAKAAYNQLCPEMKKGWCSSNEKHNTGRLRLTELPFAPLRPPGCWVCPEMWQNTWTKSGHFITSILPLPWNLFLKDRMLWWMDLWSNPTIAIIESFSECSHENVRVSTAVPPSS